MFLGWMCQGKKKKRLKLKNSNSAHVLQPLETWRGIKTPFLLICPTSQKKAKLHPRQSCSGHLLATKTTSSLARLSFRNKLAKITLWGRVWTCVESRTPRCVSRPLPRYHESQLLSACHVPGAQQASPHFSLTTHRGLRSMIPFSRWFAYMRVSSCVHKMCSYLHVSLCLFIQMQTDLCIWVFVHTCTYICVSTPSCCVLVSQYWPVTELILRKMFYFNYYSFMSSLILARPMVLSILE